MRKFALIATCFFIFQIPVVIHALDAKDQGMQKSDLPRALLTKTESSLTIKKGEPITLFSHRLTPEEILERIAAQMKVNINFYCEDPGLKPERAANLKLSGDSIVKVLEQLLSGDHRYTLLNREGKTIEGGKDIDSVNIYPKHCPGTDSPVRIFMASEPPGLRKPPEQVSLEELGDVLKKLGPASRVRAADILGRKADERGIAYAEKALKDENLDVMFAAANALMRLGQKYGSNKVASAIYARFQEKPYAEFLPVIARVDRDKIWPIAEVLIDKSGAKEKSLIVRALSLTNDRKAVKYLLKISTSSMENAKQAIYAMGKIGGAEAAADLAGLLREGDDQRQVFAAQAIHFLPTEDGLEARAEVEKAVRKAGVSDGFLGALLEAGYLEPFEKLLRDPASEPGTKVRALNAMGQWADEGTFKVVGIGLKDEAPQVRLASVQAMSSVGLKEAIPLLISATGDKDAKVRSAAVKGLSGCAGDDRVLEAVGKAIHDTDQSVRRSAVDTLRMLRAPGKPSEKMIAILNDCKNHEDPYVVDKADSILREWDSK